MRLSFWIKRGRALAIAAVLAPAAAQATVYDQTALFDFENIAAGTALPFSDTVNGLTATFTGNASVCAVGGLFLSLTGNAVVQEFCAPGDQTGPLEISFSSDLRSASFDFATVRGAGTLNVEALENGNLVSTSTFNSTVPAGFFNGEGYAAAYGPFDTLLLTGGGDTLLAIDNIITPALPEPASILLLGTALSGFALVRRRRKTG